MTSDFTGDEIVFDRQDFAVGRQKQVIVGTNETDGVVGKHQPEVVVAASIDDDAIAFGLAAVFSGHSNRPDIDIIPQTAIEGVLATAAVKKVIAGAADQQIVTVAALQRIIADAAVEGVVARGAAKVIVADAPDDAVGSRGAHNVSRRLETALSPRMHCMKDDAFVSL